MQKAVISISKIRDCYNIKVIGRATLECSPPLRQIAKNIKDENVKCINIFMDECTGMDSTFMGVLTMLTLELKKKNSILVLYNISESNKNLLMGLGLKGLLEFKTGKMVEGREEDDNSGQSEADMREKAETVLEAHETLMEVNKENEGKFKSVVDMVKRDIEKLD